VLYLKKITVRKNNRNILTGIDLCVKKGDKVLITGESGGGKSTLLRTILFFEPAVSGDIFWAKEKINTANINQYRSHFAYVGQKAPLFEGTVKEYFHLPFTFKNNCHKIEDNKLALMYMAKFSLAESKMDEVYEELSGGEKQRITLIQSLLVNKDIYILDEVTSNLDKENIERVVDIIVEKQERTVICVSHNFEWEKKANRKFKMKDGQLLEM